MVMETLFEDKKAVIRFNEKTKAIELEWKEFVLIDDYKRIFILGFDLFKKYRAKFLLSDIRKEGVVGPVGSKWLQNEMIPKAIASGMKKVAIIMNSDIFKEFYIKNLQKSVEENEFMKYFDSIETANNWLMEK